MKRKVKFQEGGMVETPAERRVRLADEARTRSLELRDYEQRLARQQAGSQDAVRQFNQMPEVAERNERDTANRRRVGLAERARAREVERQAAARQAAEIRAADQRAIAQFNDRINRAMPVTAEQARALGAEPAQRPMNPRPTIMQRIPAAAGAVARGASRAIPGMNVVRGVTPTSLQAGADFEQEGLRQVRMANERADMEQQLGEAGDRMPTSPPAAAPAPRPAPARRPAAPAPREISADRLNDLMMGAEPATAEERIAQMRMRGRQQELEEKGTAFRKGGMVKQKAKPKKMKAGGKVAAAKPAKKMMKGGIVSKPKSKAKPMTAMKRGGMVKKGKK
jgi:hypothetical protein